MSVVCGVVLHDKIADFSFFRSPHGIQQLDVKKAILSTGSTRREERKLNCSSQSFKTTKSLNKSRLDHSLPNSSSDNASGIASCRRDDLANLKKKRLSFHHTTGKVPPDVSALVQRYEARGCVLPSLSLKCRRSSSRRQEYKDAMQLQRWKNFPQVFTVKELSLLNAKMPGWKNSESTHKDNTKENSFMRRKNISLTQNLLKARDIAKRCSNRRQKGQNNLPRFLSGDCMQMDVELTLECIDAKELYNWKQAFLADGLQAGGTKGKGIAWELKAFLDKELHEWLSITPTYRERGSDSTLSGLKRKRDYFSHLGKVDFVECERDVKLVVADAPVVPYPRSSKESVASSSPPVIATSSIPYTVLRPYAINPTLVGSTLKTLYPFTKFSHYDKLEGTRRHAVTALLLLCNGSTSLPLRPSDLSSFDMFQKNTGTSRVIF